jgi:hypothetical protein
MAINKRDTEFVSLFVLMVPEARIELAPSQGGLDFESDLGHIKKANDFSKYYDFIDFFIVKVVGKC